MNFRSGNKYHNKKIETEDGAFDSKKELKRWNELKLLEKAGEIRKLQRQVKFPLIKAQRDPKTKKVLEREVSYVADFVYQDPVSGIWTVEDVKGYKGGGAYSVFSIKRKMMLYFYHIQVKEI